MNFELPRIYPITDTRLSGISHAEQTTKLIAGGATLIQLREKHASPRDFYAAAVAAIQKAPGITLLINDRVDIAMAAGAHGVHLGQDDMTPEKARLLLGPEAIIGFSTHTIEQVRAARKLPVDYIAYGPVFGTRTKSEPHPTVGLEGLRKAREAARDLALVAIGGINILNIKEVFAAGADSAAVIGAVVSDGARIEDALNRLNNLTREGG